MVQDVRRECDSYGSQFFEDTKTPVEGEPGCSIERSSLKRVDPRSIGSIIPTPRANNQQKSEEDVVREICPLVKHKKRSVCCPRRKVSQRKTTTNMAADSCAPLRRIDIIGQLNHSAIKSTLALALGLLCLLLSLSNQGVESSVWPFASVMRSQPAAQGGLWPSMLAAMNRSSVVSRRKARNSEMQTAANGQQASVSTQGPAKAMPVPPPISKQYHYFWNHDQVEPGVMAAEANKILADAQSQTDRMAMTATMPQQMQPRASDASVTKASIDNQPTGKSALDSMQASASALSSNMMSPSSEQFTVPPAVQQQLTAMVVQMQRQQQASMMMQPKFNQQAMIGGVNPMAQRRFSTPPMNPMARLWTTGSSSQPTNPMQYHMQMQMASMNPMLGAESVVQPTNLMVTDPFQQMSLMQSRAASPAAVMAGVPIFGPYPVNPTAPYMARFPFMAPMSPMSPIRAVGSSTSQRPAASSRAATGRRRSWPFFGLGSSYLGDRSSLFASASQPVISISLPPQGFKSPAASQSTKSTFSSPLDPSAALMDLSLASTKLASAIASQMNGKLSQEKLVSSLVSAFDQAALPPVDHHVTISAKLRPETQTSEVSPSGSRRMQAPYSMVAPSTGPTSLTNSEGFQSIAEPMKTLESQLIDSSSSASNSSPQIGEASRVHRRATKPTSSSTHGINSHGPYIYTLTSELERMDDSSRHEARTRSKRSSGWKSIDSEMHTETPNRLEPFEAQKDAKVAVTLRPIYSSPWSAVGASGSENKLDKNVDKMLIRRLSVEESASNKTSGSRVFTSSMGGASSDRESKSLRIKKISFVPEISTPSMVNEDSSAKASVIIGAPVSLAKPDRETRDNQETDPMTNSLAESTRISNYFQNVEKDDKAAASQRVAESKSTQRPNLAPVVVSSVGGNMPSGPSMNVGHPAPSKSISTSMSYSIQMKGANEEKLAATDESSKQHHFNRISSGNGFTHPLVDYPGSSSIGSGGHRIQTAQQVSQSSQLPGVGNADISSSATRHVPFSVKSGPIGHSPAGQLASVLASGQQAMVSGPTGANNLVPVGSLQRQQSSESAASLANLQGKILNAFFNLRQDQQSQNNKQRSSTQSIVQPSSSLFNPNSRAMNGKTNQASTDKLSDDQDSGNRNQNQDSGSYDKLNGSDQSSSLGEPPMPSPPSSQPGSMSFFGSESDSASGGSSIGQAASQPSYQSSSLDQSLSTEDQQLQGSGSLDGSSSSTGDSSFGSRTPPSVESSSVGQVNSNGGSLGDTINLEQAIELSRYSHHQSPPNLASNITDSYTSDGPELYGSSSGGPFGQSSLSLAQSENEPAQQTVQSLGYQSFGLGQQQPQMQASRSPLYTQQQLQALGAIVSNLNLHRLSQLQLAQSNQLQPLGTASNIWTNTINGDSLAGNGLLNGYSGFTNAQLMAMQSPMAAASQVNGRSEQADEGEGGRKKSKKDQKKKHAKQVSHHYHFNSFGPSALDDQDLSPLNPLEIMGTLSANEAAFLQHQKMQKTNQKKGNKDEEKQENEDEKPKKKGFLRRFSLKNLFKKLKKEKKPSDGEDSGSSSSEGESQGEK